MEQEKVLNERESLALITNMISQAKSNYQRGGGFQFLLWGWVVMLANASHYYLEVFTDYGQPYIVWLITIPAAIVSGIQGYREGKRAQVTTHLDRMYAQVWMAAGFGIIVSLVFMNVLDYNHSAVILLIVAMATYISGQMLKFRPLIIGSVALAISSIVAFNVSVEDQYLVGAIGIIAGYLIPGYLLKRAEK